MTNEVEALVANVLDSYRVALNVGTNQGVKEGDSVTLWRIVDVKDPESGEQLGSVRLDNLKLDVTLVDAKYCVASVRSSSALFAGSAIFGTRKRIAKDPHPDREDDLVRVRPGDEATVYVRDESDDTTS